MSIHLSRVGRKQREREEVVGWTPVRRGAIYCSPRCGGNCTYEAYQSAKLKAYELCAELGPGWTPRLHENGAWHWKAVVEMGGGRLEVCPDFAVPHRERRLIGYACYLGANYVANAKTPKDAVRASIRMMAADLGGLIALHNIAVSSVGMKSLLAPVVAITEPRKRRGAR